MHALDSTEARRIAIRAQLLDAPRPTDLLAVVRQLTLLQIDPTAAVAPAADLVAWSRLGSAYQPAHLRQALEQDRTLFELNAMIRPMDDLPFFRAEMAAFPTYDKQRKWLEANAAFRRDVLVHLARNGPVLSRDIPDTSVVGWQSTGWTHERNVTQMLEFLAAHGDVAIAGRQGAQRLWDLAGRVYPAGPAVRADEALRERSVRRLRALGIARQKGTALPLEPVTVGEVGEPATIDGVPGTWRVDPETLNKPFTGRTALLSPFDRLIYDRERARHLFDFEYTLEMYKPAAQRRWGYFALPILHHDQLMGKADLTADRKRGELRINALHQDIPFTPEVTDAVHAEISHLGAWLQLTVAT